MALADGACLMSGGRLTGPASSSAAMGPFQLFWSNLGKARCMSAEAATTAPKPPSSRLSAIKGAEQAAWAAQHGVSPPGQAGQTIAGSIPRGYWERKQAAFNAIPAVPKLLGFAGRLALYIHSDTS